MEKNKYGLKTVKGKELTTSQIQMIDKLLTNKAELLRFLNKVYSSTNLTIEKKKAVSQYFVQRIIDIMLEKPEQKYYPALLVEAQKRVGNFNGGAILYHFTPRNKKDIKVLLSVDATANLIKKNQEENLDLLPEDVLPAFIYPINRYDKKFVKIMVEKEPAIEPFVKIEKKKEIQL